MAKTKKAAIVNGTTNQTDVAKEASFSEMTSQDYSSDHYAHYGIHETMLKDQVCTLAYRNAIYHNRHLFKDKIVMDIGAGTCIMSMFAARAGAKKVIAVECSNMAIMSKQIVKDNKLENIIEVVHSKVEDIKELPGGIKQVDVIISEWMGYCLFYESMLNTVIYARDKWLITNGVLFPDRAKLFICAIEDRRHKDSRVNWWDTVYDFNMASIQDTILEEPLVKVVKSEQVVTNSCCLKTIDLYTVQVKDLSFAANFTLEVNRNDYIQALMTFFTIDFTKCHKNIGFSTGPEAQWTHWKQTVFYLTDSITVKKGEEINGTFLIQPTLRSMRNLDFKINVEFHGEICELVEENVYHTK